MYHLAAVIITLAGRMAAHGFRELAVMRAQFRHQDMWRRSLRRRNHYMAALRVVMGA
jgi:hypothetical protein